MKKQLDSWGKKAERYAQEQKIADLSQSPPLIAKKNDWHLKHHTHPSKTQDVHTQHIQAHGDYFQCIGCRGSLYPRPPHMIHWDIGAEKPLQCMGTDNYIDDES